MFTGIIQAVGNIQSREMRGGDARLTINAAKLDMGQVKLGDSIAVNGVCLTAIELNDSSFTADVSSESLSRTTLGQLKSGSGVNLELALTPTTHLGGHLVSGHVDGVGEIIKRWSDARSERFLVRAPENLAKYIAEKGSICVDGISLTVNGVDGCEFDLNIVPHTLDMTTMGEFKPGQRVNLEVDIIARYLERLLLGDKAAEKNSKITMSFLAEHGFLRWKDG
ncbi:riboflavin synthase [Kaarinaea lacus]